MSPATKRGLLWMLAAQLLFAAMAIFTRLSARTVSWPEVAAARFFVGGLVALAVARTRGATLRIADRPNAWRRSIFGTLSACATFYALSSPRISIGDAATLSATTPIFIALFSTPLLGERVGNHLSLAIFTSFLGVVAVVEPSFATAAPVALIATAGAVLSSLAMIWLRKIGPTESGEAVVLHFSIVASAVMIALSLPDWRNPDITTIACLIATGVTGGLAQVAMTRAYALERAARIGTLNYLGIVFTHLMAIPVFREPTTESQVLGATLVIGGGLLVTGGPARRKETPEAIQLTSDSPRHTATDLQG